MARKLAAVWSEASVHAAASLSLFKPENLHDSEISATETPIIDGAITSTIVKKSSIEELVL